MSKQTKVIIAAIVLLVVILAGALTWSLYKTHETKAEMSEMVEMMNFEKEQLEEEYTDLAMQFDGYGMNIGNDSLVQLLDKEKQKVAQLLEELRVTKATNARRIAALKKELATVRSVMIQYVHQIDSLDRMNKELIAENTEVRRKYETASHKAEQLQQEKEELHQTVVRASMLELTDFSMQTLNDRGRKTRRYSQIAKLQFNYTLAKNITTTSGIKTLYLRIIRPDGEVMSKSDQNLFPFENTELLYSLSKQFEYAGEELSDVLYWNVQEILQVGDYTADFFVDGHQIGRFSFRIDD